MLAFVVLLCCCQCLVRVIELVCDISVHLLKVENGRLRLRLALLEEDLGLSIRLQLLFQLQQHPIHLCQLLLPIGQLLLQLFLRLDLTGHNPF